MNDATYNLQTAYDDIAAVNRNNPNDIPMVIQDGKYREARRFAQKNGATDMDGVTIIDAAKKFGKHGKALEDLVSIEFSKRGDYHEVTKQQLLKLSQKQNNNKFDKILNQMIYINKVMGPGRLLGEKSNVYVPPITAKITSYLDSESLNDIVNKISKINLKPRVKHNKKSSRKNKNT